MALALHKILQDGSIAHEDFTRASWERAMRDASLLRFWAHPPDDCHDPVERLWEKLGRRVELVEGPKVIPPAAEPALTEPVAWPPDSTLSPQQLARLSGMAEADCEDLLATPKEESPTVEPLADRDGQLNLF